MKTTSISELKRSDSISPDDLCMISRKTGNGESYSSYAVECSAIAGEHQPLAETRNYQRLVLGWLETISYQLSGMSFQLSAMQTQISCLSVTPTPTPVAPTPTPVAPTPITIRYHSNETSAAPLEPITITYDSNYPAAEELSTITLTYHSN